MIIELDGKTLKDESDFHEAISKAFDLSDFYGRNLSALADVLGTDVERPIQLIWNDAAESRKSMGDRFNDLVRVLRRVEEEDIEIGYDTRFELILK